MTEGLDIARSAADREAFVAAMAGAVTGVTVLTTDGAAGRFGLTVSATASVSADPPMLLACVNSRSPAAAAIRRNGAFGINLLGAGQFWIADIFAGRSSPDRNYDFDCADWRAAASGAPLLKDAVASFDCELVSAQEAGSHIVFIGRVASVASTPAPRSPIPAAPTARSPISAPDARRCSRGPLR